MGNRIYDFLVDFIANFAAAILTHPVMNESVLNVVVQGVDKLMEQPNLDEHVLKAGHTMAKNRDVLAHKAGKDFPKVAGAFVKGMVHVGNPEKNQQDGGDEDHTSTTEENSGSKTSANEGDHTSTTDETNLAEERDRLLELEVLKDPQPPHKMKKKSPWLHPMHMIRHPH